MDPAYFAIMDDVAAMLRQVFVTANPMTFCLPTTGMGAMETAFANLVEPGDTVIIGVAGFFAGRMVEIARRLGAQVTTVETEWGQPVPVESMRPVIERMRPKVVALVHGETSTGVEQPIAEMVALAHDHSALVLVDTVASLGGVPFPVDRLGVDICYGGSQKCLSAPPGIAPITVAPRAMEAIRARRTPVPSFYMDLTLQAHYWGDEHLYHHTPAIPLMYAMHEALRLVLAEGLEARWQRHAQVSKALRAGLTAMGLRLFATPAHRLASLTTVVVPPGVDEARLRRELLQEYDIEIGGGLGPYKGKLWRIGLMGHSARMPNVMLLLTALEDLLTRQGVSVPRGAGLAAAAQAGMQGNTGE
jgi:alanine-glyoxylate transaminase/serine-glyoxylate transaminase/serine-pyruvate transaminase